MTRDNIEYVTAIIGTISNMTGAPCSKVYSSLQTAGLINGYLVECYDVLHTLSLEYVAQDVINHVKNKGLTL